MVLGAGMSGLVGNIGGVIIMILFWFFSYRWTFKKAQATPLEPDTQSNQGVQIKITPEVSMFRDNDNKDVDLADFQINTSSSKHSTPKRKTSTHDDLVEFNDESESDVSTEKNVLQAAIQPLAVEPHGNKENIKPTINTHQSFEDSNQANLNSFKITSPSTWSEQAKPKKKTKTRWVTPNETVTVRNYQVQGGYFYLGHDAGYNTEASLIDPTLNVNSRSPDYEGEQMGYWPSYQNISSSSRAAYIEWLAGDRSDPDAYIGYVFLYFYGIERRILVDGEKGVVSEEEHNALIRELYRLKTVYGHNRSFNGYVSALMSQVWVLYHSHQKPDPKLFIGKRGFTSAFKYSLAQIVSKRLPIPSELALAWVKNHPEYHLRTPARRCHKEFDQLFTTRYLSSFGDGLVVKPNRTKLVLDYHPANASLNRYDKKKLDLPDVSLLKTPVKKLIALAESCTQELNPYSLFLGRKGNTKDSLMGISLLPTDLLSSIEHPKFERLKTWMESQINESQGLVSVESFLELLGEDAPLKINKKEATMLANLAEKAGFGIAPDIRFHYAKPDINEKLVLFVDGHESDFTPSHSFKKIGTILRLGAMVAVIDGQIHSSEVDTLKQLIDEDKQLSNTEKPSLHAYLHWRLNTPTNMVGLKARIETINDREKRTISHILVSVALADGVIDPAEIKQLEKLYTSLGLDKSMVITDLHHLSSSKARLVTTEQPRKVPSTSEKQVVSDTPAAFTLNRELLKVYEEETQGAKSLLESVFVDEQEIEETEEENSSLITSDIESTVTGLDEKHHALYQKLISKEEWLMDEVKTLCTELNLMVDGAFEVINDWAFDQVDAPLIDDGSTVYIDLELVEEIASL